MAGSDCCNCFCCLMFLVIILIGTYVIVNYATNGKAGENINGMLPDGLNNKTAQFWGNLFSKEDPFAGLNGTHAWQQPIRGVGGLNITLINALDDRWHSYFYAAVTDWDNGTPDALTLSTELQQPDANCSAEPGYIKVCNGNYGDTNWKGINQISMDDNTGLIYSSVALMNEYYLTSTDSDDDKQYTMCHEIGHGFGLPHTDENFYNRNLGNCLDYTLYPRTDKHPGTVNYEKLSELYGIVGSPTKSPLAYSSSSSSNAGISSVYGSNAQQQQQASTPLSQDGNYNGGRNLRQNPAPNTKDTKNTFVRNPPIILDDDTLAMHREAFEEIHSYFTNSHRHDGEEHNMYASSSRQLNGQLSLIAENHLGQIYRYDIGNDHYIQVRVLLATSS